MVGTHRLTVEPVSKIAPVLTNHADGTRHTIRIEHVHRILHGARLQNMDVEPLLRRAGISAALLESPAGVVTVKQYASLLQTLRRYLRDEIWGLCKHPVLPGTFAQLCELLIHRTTLKDAFVPGLRFTGYICRTFLPNSTFMTSMLFCSFTLPKMRRPKQLRPQYCQHFSQGF